MKAPLPPWQREQWDRTLRSAMEGFLAHALLLTGPAGVGKQVFAEALARALLCHADAARKPCGECPSCAQVEAATHPDLVRVQPDKAGRALGIDAIRNLTERVSLTAGGAAKVAMIGPAEAMTRSAANSLLKTLEEPPSGTFILLVSAHPGRLPATVRSRCQRLGFPVPPTDDALAWLREQSVADPERWLALAAGGPFAALALAQTADTGQEAAGVDPVDALIAVLRGARSPVAAAAAVRPHGLEVSVRAWIAAIEDLIRLGTDGEAPLRHFGHRDRLLALAPRLDARALFDYLDGLYRSMPGPSSALREDAQLEGLLAEAAVLAAGDRSTAADT